MSAWSEARVGPAPLPPTADPSPRLQEPTVAPQDLSRVPRHLIEGLAGKDQGHVGEGGVRHHERVLDVGQHVREAGRLLRDVRLRGERGEGGQAHAGRGWGLGGGQRECPRRKGPAQLQSKGTREHGPRANEAETLRGGDARYQAGPGMLAEGPAPTPPGAPQGGKRDHGKRAPMGNAQRRPLGRQRVAYRFRAPDAPARRDRARRPHPGAPRLANGGKRPVATSTGASKAGKSANRCLGESAGPRGSLARLRERTPAPAIASQRKETPWRASGPFAAAMGPLEARDRSWPPRPREGAPDGTNPADRVPRSPPERRTGPPGRRRAGQWRQPARKSRWTAAGPLVAHVARKTGERRRLAPRKGPAEARELTPASPILPARPAKRGCPAGAGAYPSDFDQRAQKSLVPWCRWRMRFKSFLRQNPDQGIEDRLFARRDEMGG